MTTTMHATLIRPRPCRGFRRAGLLGGAALLALAVAAPRAVADESGTSEIRVAVTSPLPAAPTGGSALAYHTIPALGIVRAGGTIGTRGTNTVTDPAAAWTDATFAAGATHYLVVTDGTGAGWWAVVTAVDVAARQLTLGSALDSAVEPGDRYQVRRMLTVAEVFGGANAGVLQPGPNPSAADNLLLFDPATQTTRTLFVSDVTGAEGWYDATFAPAGETGIPPGWAFAIRRRGAATGEVTYAGALRQGFLRVTVQPGLNLLGTLRSREPLTLAASGLVTGEVGTGLAPGPSLTQADRVILLGEDGQADYYFFSSVPGFTGWTDEAFQPAAATALPAGGSFFVLRQEGLPPFTWILPPDITEATTP